MSQISKLDFVNKKLGAPLNSQDTTRCVYDSVSAAITAAGTVRTLKFFDSFANKTTLQILEIDLVRNRSHQREQNGRVEGLGRRRH